MNPNNVNEPLILETPAPLDDGGRKYNFIYAAAILGITLFSMVFWGNGLFQSLAGGVLLGGIAGVTIKDFIMGCALRKLPSLKFSVKKKIPYDHIIGSLQPILLPIGMTLEKNEDGSISITYKKMIYNISYNEDDTFRIDWNQSVLGSLFSVSSRITIYRKVVTAMGMIAYHIQQICNENAAAGTESVAANIHLQENVIFCTKCGYKNSSGNTFCTKCGNPMPPGGSLRSTSLESNPHTARRRSGAKAAWAFKLSGFAILAAAVFFFIGKAEEKKYIESVKNGHPEIYENISYGQAFDSFFSAPEWKYFESTDGNDVVQFSGGCTYQGSEVTATIQFILDYEGGTFTTGAFDLNGVPQNEFMTYAIITNVFDDYGKNNSGHTIDIE